MTALAPWQNFFVIAGSSAGALIGLQFVVLSVITGRRMARVDPNAGAAYSTPTILHFSAVLGLSAILSAPWDGIVPAATAWGVVGLAGAVYTVVVIRRMRTQTAYRPEFEDWLFHAVLPFAAYASLTGSACAAPFHPREALFGVGAPLIVLLFAGIHNAWDAVTYHVFTRSRDRGDH